MTVLMVFVISLETLYVYCGQRLWIKSWFRDVHSKSYLRKLKQNSSTLERITGFYLLHSDKRKRKLDRLVLFIINIDLISIPLFLLMACLKATAHISEQTFIMTFTVIAGRVLFALFLQLIIMLLCRWSEK